MGCIQFIIHAHCKVYIARLGESVLFHCCSSICASCICKHYSLFFFYIFIFDMSVCMAWCYLYGPSNFRGSIILLSVHLCSSFDITMAAMKKTMKKVAAVLAPAMKKAMKKAMKAKAMKAK